MRAVVYTKYGDPSVLSTQEVGKPAPAPNELLVEVHATEVTKADCEMRSFNFPTKLFVVPLRLVFGITKPKKNVLGLYFAGEVAAVGSEVTRFNVGDKIFGSSQLKLGGYAEYLCVPEHYTLTTQPKNISHAESASLTLGGLNALHFMNLADLKKGDRIMIIGAGGSIGLHAVQMAKAAGALVTAVDHGRKEDMLRQIGADDFIDYTKQSFSNNAEKYDVIFNMIVSTPFKSCINMLNEKGLYLMGNPTLSDMIQTKLTNTFSTKRANFSFASETVTELEALRNKVESGD
ncbi:NAD(P)-dependent alcohol dehydrogenase [Veronia nyctiphanis]|uniref:NAD(P)-dependent alcohol dehydrogenase n=1 Tax=Veronia nyctiphanis TaxID=1278244 RepID=UPI00191BFC7A|nr:NAD(P)-dependent alcohol dehydrogenase [Veronia nyctiphanis]